MKTFDLKRSRSPKSPGIGRLGELSKFKDRLKIELESTTKNLLKINRNGKDKLDLTLSS